MSISSVSATVTEMENWNADGRKRMDDLLKPAKEMLPEERVMYTMELQSDIEGQVRAEADFTRTPGYPGCWRIPHRWRSTPSCKRSGRRT